MFAAGKPNLSSPRTAWMINAIKTGTLYSSIVPDGDFDRVDPVSKFEKNFPPTYFVHGTADVFSKVEISEKMTKELLELGAQAEMVRTEGQPHVFDIMLKEEDELFKGVVMDAFRWLESHV